MIGSAPTAFAVTDHKRGRPDSARVPPSGDLDVGLHATELVICVPRVQFEPKWNPSCSLWRYQNFSTRSSRRETRSREIHAENMIQISPMIKCLGSICWVLAVQAMVLGSAPVGLLGSRLPSVCDHARSSQVRQFVEYDVCLLVRTSTKVRGPRRPFRPRTYWLSIGRSPLV